MPIPKNLPLKASLWEGTSDLRRSDARGRAGRAPADPHAGGGEQHRRQADSRAGHLRRLTPHALPSLGAWTVDVAYDPKAVKVVSCEGANGSLCNADFQPGAVRITGASASGLRGEQGLAQITFAGSGNGEADSALHLIPVLLAGPEGEPLIASGAATATP